MRFENPQILFTVTWEELNTYISKYTFEWLSLRRQTETGPLQWLQADHGRVPKVSETTEVKGQFGLGQSGGTGKKLKIIYISQIWPFLGFHQSTMYLEENNNG